MGLRLHHANIPSRVFVPGLMLVGPVRGLFLNKGPHEAVYHYQLQMWFLQLLNPIHHLFHHEVMVNLSLGWTSVCQDSQVKGAPLHPLLLSQCIKSGIIAKLGFHNVGEATREQNNRWITS